MNNLTQKRYVDVILKNDKEGEIRPLTIIIEDKEYEITRVKQKCKASSLKVGGCGMRYTIVVNGKETYIFHEDNKWFIESRSRC